MDAARDRRIRIHMEQPALGYLSFLIENLKPLALLLGEDERGGFVEARFGPDEPSFLVDRIEAWINALEEPRLAMLQSARGMSPWSPGWQGCFSGQVLRSFFLRPPWTPPRPGLLDLVIDPEGGFGSGQHPATQACLREVERCAALLPETGLPMLDVGAGTGVLALAAARLGMLPTAVEREPAARDACRRNAEANGLVVRVLDSTSQVTGQYPLVAANLCGNYVRSLAGVLTAALAPGGALVLGGFGPGEREQVQQSYPALQLEQVTPAEDGDWIALTLRAA